MTTINIQGEIQSSPLNTNFSELQNQITTNATNLQNHQNSDTAHSASDIVNDSSVSGTKVSDVLNNLNVRDGQLQTDINNRYTKSEVDTKVDDLQTQIDNHNNSTAAHNDDSIVNTSNVAGAKVKDALNELKVEDENLNTRIDNIIAQSGTSDTEVVDARNSTQYGTYGSLNARLEAIETRSKYFFKEEHTVLKDNNEIILTNIPENNHELLIYDTKFGCIWQEGVHWNRNGQIITFTSSMPQDLDFIIYNIG